VVLLHMNIANNVKVAVGVSLGTEVPRLGLGVIISFLKTLELIIEVKDVIRLLVPERIVFILSEGVQHALRLQLLLVGLLPRFVVLLSDWVVNGVGMFDEFVGDFFIGFGDALEVFLFVLVVSHVCLPFIVTVGHSVRRRQIGDGVCNRLRGHILNS